MKHIVDKELPAHLPMTMVPKGRFAGSITNHWRETELA
jgi:hypothetical protein